MTVNNGQSDKVGICSVHSVLPNLIPYLFQLRRKLGLVNVEDLALDFTIPGYDIELRVRGSV